MFSENFTKRVYQELCELISVKNIDFDSIYDCKYVPITFKISDCIKLYSGNFNTEHFNLCVKENFHDLCNLLKFNLYTEQQFGLLGKRPKLYINIKTICLGSSTELLVEIHASKADETEI